MMLSLQMRRAKLFFIKKVLVNQNQLRYQLGHLAFIIYLYYHQRKTLSRPQNLSKNNQPITECQAQFLRVAMLIDIFAEVN